MRFIALIAALLCAILHLALAAPFTELRRQRAADRAARRSSPLIPAKGADPNARSRTSSNWGGAILKGEGVVSVTGEFTVPVPKPGTNTAGKDSSATVWVGIDGDESCPGALLQTGVDMMISKLDFVTYIAWFEWFPQPPSTFDNMVIVAGDKVTMTITTDGTSSGSATIINQSNGYRSTIVFFGEPDLCLTTAEWIVEDYEQGDGSMVPFANFGSVAITNTYAQVGSQYVGVKDAQVIDIRQNNKDLTSCSLPDDYTVNCQYIG
ncbi:Bcacp1 [Apiospora marii]|uniref:Bcacp1 n=1 Tax=Apiospora marii TaxID=335849 RepID=A0ABR1RCZ7_9PEZI